MWWRRKKKYSDYWVILAPTQIEEMTKTLTAGFTYEYHTMNSAGELVRFFFIPKAPGSIMKCLSSSR